jgi:hypothetical protein
MSKNDEQEGKKDPIKVTDRRAFTLDGERRRPEAEAEPEPPSSQVLKGEGFELRPSQPQAPGAPPVAVEFSSFILSLASTAFIQLGELEDPVTHRIEQNLEGARQMIEILDMLRAKTQGNLDAQELEFLTGVLYELKLKFARKASKP